MTTHKYRFEVYYSSPNMQKVSDFLAKCDLNTGELALKDVITFNTTSTHITTNQYIAYLKECLESCSYKVFSIEGGKVESIEKG